MQSTPFYLSDFIMPFYKATLIFAFMLGASSVLAGISYSIYTMIQTDLTISTSLFHGFIIFLEGTALTAIISFTSFMAFWKKHQIKYNNCKELQATNCNDIGFFRFA
jgi:hypothetical protein